MVSSDFKRFIKSTHMTYITQLIYITHIIYITHKTYITHIAKFIFKTY